MAGVGDMETMDNMESMGSEETASSVVSALVSWTPWTLNGLVLTFVMWSVMMIAMMTPSATPIILLYANVCRKRLRDRQPFVPVALFFTGYLVVWTVFSASATLLQSGLQALVLLSPMLVSISAPLTGVLLVMTALYQWTPTKRTCLRNCRSPVDFLSRHWRAGRLGALRMGVEHGLYCLGCCWALMLLLFVGGVMNLLWVAGLAIFILAEKTLPYGWTVSRVGALVFAGAGAIILLRLV
jgi:predicted metal-binding membrane protein